MTNAKTNNQIGFIGGGNMARSLIGGLLSETANASQIWVHEPNADVAKKLVEDFAIQLADNNDMLVQNCDVIVVAVKPQVLKQVITPLADALKKNPCLLISIVAGIRADTIQEWLQAPQAIVRVMPNTPALVGVGASAMYANQHSTEQHLQISQALLNAVGYSTWVDSEADIDSVTALSGSGPAYFMLFMKALIDAATDAGLPEESAKQLAIETARGAAELVHKSDATLPELIRNVTSPAGTTEQALQTFSNHKLEAIVKAAFESARIRSIELAEEFK